MFQLLPQTFFKIFWVCRCTLLLSNSSCYWQFLKPGVNKIFESVTYKFVVESENNRYTFQGCTVRKLKGTQSSELEKSRVLSAWFFWKKQRFSSWPRTKVGHQWQPRSARAQPACKIIYSRTQLFRSPKRNVTKFEIAGFRNNRGSIKFVTMIIF